MKVGSSAGASAQDSKKKINPKPKLAVDAAFKKSRSGVQIYVEKYGSGKKVEKGDALVVHYEGWLAKDYTLFDSSRAKRKPFEYIQGEGAVIPGWEEAIEGIRVGSKLQLKIPANMAYGASGHPGVKIPPNADLIFKVQVVRAK